MEAQMKQESDDSYVDCKEKECSSKHPRTRSSSCLKNLTLSVGEECVEKVYPSEQDPPL